MPAEYFIDPRQFDLEPMKKRSYPGIKGNLEITSYDSNGAPCVNIHGDPEGLRSRARLLDALADLDQKELNYPDGAREHVHLDSDWQLSRNSHRTIVGRLDEKGTQAFPNAFKARTKKYQDAT